MSLQEAVSFPYFSMAVYAPQKEKEKKKKISFAANDG